jgi:hypothetical protein
MATMGETVSSSSCLQDRQLDASGIRRRVPAARIVSAQLSVRPVVKVLQPLRAAVVVSSQLQTLWHLQYSLQQLKRITKQALQDACCAGQRTYQLPQLLMPHQQRAQALAVSAAGPTKSQTCSRTLTSGHGVQLRHFQTLSSAMFPFCIVLAGAVSHACCSDKPQSDGSFPQTCSSTITLD